MSGDGDLAHRVRALAIFDPETGGSTTVVAGHHIDADTDEVGDIETVFYVCDEFVGTQSAGLQVEIAGARRGHRRCAALGMTSRDKAEFACSGTIEQPGRKHTVIDQCELLAGNAFAIERTRTQAA